MKASCQKIHGLKQMRVRDKQSIPEPGTERACERNQTGHALCEHNMFLVKQEYA